ncbi:MAG: hypothetical protein A2Z11_02480 [Candidatus Woykebacteria bacterium RBG_16_43_9]|uniref:Uncharacterized protein n=1 Tax=Candidatus Woykebacteria bacterium RBG_16_43_9 TaxID=1802596 RepID=A0A1G1WGD2_9BACT|nr:MAG: hypothetical protein A2Z11_02480 [Candidatus Woykebacteria bacterium RBG_16_43_9]
MEHIQNWPAHLNTVALENGRSVVKLMFQTTEEEKAFWAHISACNTCSSRVLNDMLVTSFPIPLEDEWVEATAEAFVAEIDNYLEGVHPSEEHLIGAFPNYIQKMEESLDNTDEGNINEPIDPEEAHSIIQAIETLQHVGSHTLICGSCCEKEWALLAQVPGKMATVQRFLSMLVKYEERIHL